MFNLNLQNISTKDLEKELSKRKDRNLGRCETCGGKWSVYMGCSDYWKTKPHCFERSLNLLSSSCSVRS